MDLTEFAAEVSADIRSDVAQARARYERELAMLELLRDCVQIIIDLCPAAVSLDIYERAQRLGIYPDVAIEIEDDFLTGMP